jgi:hypothetical protein
VLRAIMDISARAISLPERPRSGHLGHQCSHALGRPNLHLVSSSRRPRLNLVDDAGEAPDLAKPAETARDKPTQKALVLKGFLNLGVFHRVQYRPYVFAVRNPRAVPRFVTIASAPLGGTGWRSYALFRPSVKTKYFLFWGLTQFPTIRSDLPVGSICRACSLHIRLIRLPPALFELRRTGRPLRYGGQVVIASFRDAVHRRRAKKDADGTLISARGAG